MQDEIDLSDIPLSNYIADESGCHMQPIQQSDEAVEQYAHFSHGESEMPMSIVKIWVERYYRELEYDVTTNTYIEYTEFSVTSSFEKLRVRIRPAGKMAFTLEVKKV